MLDELKQLADATLAANTVLEDRIKQEMLGRLSPPQLPVVVDFNNAIKVAASLNKYIQDYPTVRMEVRKLLMETEYDDIRIAHGFVPCTDTTGWKLDQQLMITAQ